MRARLRCLIPLRWIILILLGLFALPAAAQNTKGDKPVNNERKIRETKGKTVKRKDKGKTRDIAGRRLRTKDKSSANRANVGIRQPDPYAGRPRVTTDRAAKPRGRVYSERPTDKPRVARGDISGHPIRASKPRKAEAARKNIYPQQYVSPVSPKHQSSRPPRYKSSASGQPLVRRMPQAKERAWKGDIKGQPVAPPRSVSAQRQNTFPQNKDYARYAKRRAPGDRSVSNKGEVGRAQKLSRKPHTSDRGGGYVTSGNKGFVKRGRKNVYWGKFSKGERAVTTDLTGRPVRTRNYRSPSAGLVGRDTLKHFGRRPHGDVSFAGGRTEQPGVRTSNQGRGWRGDISGHRLRSGRRSPGDRASIQQFPGFLSISKSGEVGKPMRSAPFSQTTRTGKVGKRLPPRQPGIAGLTIAEDLRRTRGGPTKGFTKGGEGFSGFIKVRKRSAGPDVGSFSGNMLSNKGFQNQGEGFSGYTKARKPLKGGGSVSGNLWNNNGRAVTSRTLPRSADRPGRFSGNMLSNKGFQTQGEGFAGYIKAQKPVKGGGSVSGKLWNNNGQAVTGRTLPRGADKPGRFSGNVRGGKVYGDQGAEFTGYLKARKPLKGGGSVSGKLWNNDGKAVTELTLPRESMKPGRFSGNLQGSDKAYGDQGAEFTGYIKAKKPEKGGGSVSGKLWNNQGQPVTQLPSKSASINAASFEGKSRFDDKKPSTGGFDGEGKYTVKKSGKTSTGGFDGEGKHSVRVAGKPSTGGFDTHGKIRLKEQYTQSPQAVAASTKKHKPERAGFEAEGLQVRVAKKSMSTREHSVPGALPGEGPRKGSVRASVYASGARTPDRRHNPYAADEALKGTYYGGKSNLGTFHGNIRARKFESDRRFHPDAKFAHSPDNNVKEERTFMTNVKLWWTNLFHDSESQPTSVREKERRPRYDKREKGMWAE
jgi:hypothetical protein